MGGISQNVIELSYRFAKNNISAWISDEIKNKKSSENSELFNLVPGTGIEPAHP